MMFWNFDVDAYLQAEYCVDDRQHQTRHIYCEHNEIGSIHNVTEQKGACKKKKKLKTIWVKMEQRLVSIWHLPMDTPMGIVLK